jgi:hypothetical protein
MAGINPAMTDYEADYFELPSIYRETCADTASHRPFCRAQQSV